MRFNWIIDFDLSDEMKKLSLDMEYLLHKKITKFLISKWGDSSYYFEELVFDIDMATKRITISDKTPISLVQLIEEEFYKEFSPGHSGSKGVKV